MVIAVVLPAVVDTCQIERAAVVEGRVLDEHGVGGPPTLTWRAPIACQSAAQGAPSPEPIIGDEWQVGTGYGWSIDVLQSEGGRHYVPVTLSWARRLTREGGPGWLRGTLSWGVEVMPLYLQTAPTSTAGLGISPLVWRWRFAPRRAATPFAELAFGGLFTGHPVPEATKAANFLAHGAFGLRWRPSRHTAIVTAYRFQHISNGNQLATNPGVNAHVAWAGISLMR